jgi:hypothetical protein
MQASVMIAIPDMVGSVSSASGYPCTFPSGGMA